MADTPSKKGGKGTKATRPGKKAPRAAAPKKPAAPAKSGSKSAKPMQKPRKATPILMGKPKEEEGGGSAARPMQKPRKATPILMGKPKEEEGGGGAARPMQKPRKATPILMGKPKEEEDGGSAARPMQKPRKATPILMGKPKEEEGDESSARPMRPPSARAGKKTRTPDETTEPLGTPVVEEGAAPRAAAPQAAEAPGARRDPPRKVDVTAFPRKVRPSVPERFADIEATPAPAARPKEAAPATKPPPAPKSAPAPKPPSASKSAPAPERPRPPAEPAPRWVEASDVLVEGFFLTPEPRFAQTSAEPIGEGFFVARVAGEEAARRHGLTDRPRQGPPDSFDEDLGELPVSYGEDDVLALPRDPHSLFFFWDFKSAEAGGGRAVLRVFDGDQLIREVEFTPEQRSFYLHDLPAGRTYRLEAHLLDASGAARLIGHARMVSLPGEGPVRTTEVRFLKLPWHLALARLREYMREGHAQVEVVQGKEAFAAWIRTPLPSSAALQEGIVGERVVSAGAGEGPESVGHWRPSPSGQSWSK